MVNLHSVETIPALRNLLVELACDLPNFAESGRDVATLAQSLQIEFVDERGHRSKFFGRSQLPSLQSAREVLVSFASSSPRSVGVKERAPLLIEDDDVHGDQRL